MNDKDLIAEILQTLRMNMLRGTMTTQNDEQFMRFLEAWSQGKTAIGIVPKGYEMYVQTKQP